MEALVSCGSGIMRLLSACGSGIMRQGRLAMMFVIAQCAGGQLNCFELYSKRKAVCLVPYVPWCLDEVEWRGSGMGFVGMYCADFWYVGSRGYPGVGSMVGLVWDWFDQRARVSSISAPCARFVVPVQHFRLLRGGLWIYFFCFGSGTVLPRAGVVRDDEGGSVSVMLGRGRHADSGGDQTRWGISKSPLEIKVELG